MLEISESDILATLNRDNPWWTGHDSVLGGTYSHSRGYRRAFEKLALNLDVRRSVILMGPRRVGKTIMLRQLIDTVLSKGFPPNNILFASVDTPTYYNMPLEQFVQILLKAPNFDRSGPALVIFDEVQYRKDWEVHLKVLTDQFPQIRFIASGSAAAALKLKSLESGAGRFTDFYLPPLTFAEFLDFRDRSDDLIFVQDESEEKSFNTPNIHELNIEFLNYLNFGGYPEAVLNTEIRAEPQRFIGRDIIDKVLLRDLPSLYGIQNVQELNQLFTVIAYQSGLEISLEGLAKSSGVAKNTISKYLEYLEAAFLIVRVNRVDQSGKKFHRVHRFKAYLTNPSMRAALFSPLDDGDAALGTMVETAILSQWFHSPARENLHYARWKKGKTELETDIVGVNPANQNPVWATEVKWSDRFVDHPEKLKGLIAFARRNELDPTLVFATSKTLNGRSEVGGITVTHLPSALYCYEIGRRLIDDLSA